jgi:hypothetical protein
MAAPQAASTRSGSAVTPDPTVTEAATVGPVASEPLNLATSDYRSFDFAWGVPIITTVGKPRRGPLAGVDAIGAIAPYGLFNVKPALPEPVFRSRYVERLAEKADEIDVALHDLAAAHPGERLVVCCWCKVSTLDDFCHRLIFRRWAEERWDIEVPELAIHPAKPVVPSDPTLFD